MQKAAGVSHSCPNLFPIIPWGCAFKRVFILYDHITVSNHIIFYTSYVQYQCFIHNLHLPHANYPTCYNLLLCIH